MRFLLLAALVLLTLSQATMVSSMAEDALPPILYNPDWSAQEAKQVEAIPPVVNAATGEIRALTAPEPVEESSEAPSTPPPEPPDIQTSITGPDHPGRTGTMISSVAPTTAGSVGEDYYHLQGKKITRWNDQTKNIMVYIADGSHLPGWNPENIQRVKAAFAEWEQAMAPRFHFIFMPDSRGSDVTVQWAARIGSDRTDSGEAAGINEYQTWGKHIAKNNIQLALVTPWEEPCTPSVIQSVALHEIGHMLGIKAHSDVPGDIMFPGQAASSVEEPHHLSQRDINTMKRIYTSKAEYSNPEGYHLSDFESFKKTQKGRRMSLLWVPIPGVPFPVPVPLPF